MYDSLNILPNQNLAPMRPLYELSQGNKNPTPTYIQDGLIELLKDLLGRNAETYREIANTVEITSNFIQGKQLWQPNYWNGQWSVVPFNKTDPSKITAINIMQFYATTQVKMITSSNPDIEPVDEYRTKEYRKQVRKAKAVWNKYEKRFYTAHFNHQEAIHAIVTGNYIESVQYDHLKKGITVFKEIFETKDIEIDSGSSKCFGCGYKGTYKEFVGPSENNVQFIPNCPECGSHEILPPTSPVNRTFQSVSGMQPIQTGDLSIKLIPIQTFRYDLSKRAEESSWSIERIEIDKNKLKYLLGGLNISGSGDSVDPGLKSLKSIAQASNTLAGKYGGYSNRNNGNREKTVVVDRLCIKPEDVCHIVNLEDTETVSGEIIPKGQRLSDFVPPEGATILFANEKDIIGIYLGIHHSQEIRSGVYHMRFNSGLGRGSEDTVEVQKRFNRLDNQNVKFMDATSTPGSTYVTGSVDRNHIKKIGHPGVNIPISQSVAESLGTTELIRRLPPGQMPAQFFSYTYDILNQFRQLTAHSTDFTNAFPGVDNKTATGARLAKSNADSVWSPFQQLKAEVRVGIAQNTLRLYNKHFQGIPQDFSIGETKSKQTISSSIKGEDINCDIEFTVVRDSEQPKTMYDRQTDFANMMMLVGNVGGIDALKAAEPKLLSSLYKSFDIDLGQDTYDTLVDVCENRLEHALSLYSQFIVVQKQFETIGSQLPIPPIETILQNINPQIIIEEPSHEQKARWFMEYLDTPEGIELDSDSRQVVALFVKAHFEMAVEQGKIMGSSEGAKAAAAQEPMIEQQRQLALEQAALQDEQRQKDLQVKVLEAENKNAESEKDRQHDVQMVDVQTWADKELAILESSLKIVEQHNAPRETAKPAVKKQKQNKESQ